VNKDVNIIELFSGIGGFTLGLQKAGFNINKHYFSEIDKHAIANYKYNYEKAEYIGSVVDFQGKRGQADIITFGSPCQDFSLAGKRKGLKGERSSLIGQAIRIIDEVRPSVFIWENVKGAFSSNNGADFWAILAAFTNLGDYRLGWQLLNTSWVLPQNRERIYLIGHLAGRSEPGVFPIGEEFSRSFKGTKQTSNTFTAGGNSGGMHSSMTLIQPVLTPNRKQKRQNGRRFKEDGEPAFTLNCQDQHGIMINKTNIRRLTEIECERLQGFPDGWTKYGNYNGEVKEISKTQRYKMLGNAVTADIVKLIGQKLLS